MDYIAPYMHSISLIIISIPSLDDNEIDTKGCEALSEALTGMTNLQYFRYTYSVSVD